MIVRRLDQLEPERSVRGRTWTSRRLLLAGDGMGFSVHDTVLDAGSSTEMWYRNHLEAVYCVGGTGHILDHATGEVHRVQPGTLYALNDHDKHTLHAETALRMVCVFNPPVVGPEDHDEHGGYELLRADPYWSRIGSEEALAKRVDPVVYPGVAGPLAPEQVRAFERDGFLVVEGLLDGETVAAALDEAARLARERAHTEEVVAEPDSDVVRSVFRVHETGDRLARLAREDRLSGVARQLLGSDVYLHQSRVNDKPPLDGREFFWHSDFETWHVEDGMPRPRAVSASISLTGSHEFNGPLMLIPGSHRVYVRCVGETPLDHYKLSLRRQEVGVPSRAALEQLVAHGGIVAPKGPPGTVVFFDCNTMHGSVGNLSTEPRTNLFFVYNSVENQLVAPFGGTKPRPAHIATR